jgi:DNA-binding MarR family transcriptional regulator
MAADRQTCSRALLETVPVVMRFIREQMRRSRGSQLSVPQFRSLLFADRRGDASPGELADHLGLTAPSTTKLLDGLERRGFLTRGHSDRDRRRVTLGVTASGRQILSRARESTQASLAAALAAATPQTLAAISRALAELQRLFAAPAVEATGGEASADGTA